MVVNPCDTPSHLTSTMSAIPFANITDCTQPQWTVQLAVRSIILALSLVFNIIVLVDFIRIPSRVTPFTVYLIALLISNILYLSVVTLPGFLNQLYGRWLFGWMMCRVHNYFLVVWSAVSVMMHVTISVNRLWAVWLPMSYKHHHNKQVAGIVCCLGVLLAHAGGLPSVIIDAMWAATSSCRQWERQCGLNYKVIPLGLLILDWGTLHAAPTVFIIGSYIQVFVDHHRRKVQRERSVAERMPLSANNSLNSLSSLRHQGKRESVRPYLILSLTVTSICVCWVPPLIIFTAGWVPWISPCVLHTYFAVAIALYSMQALFDPLLFAICLYIDQFKMRIKTRRFV